MPRKFAYSPVKRATISVRLAPSIKDVLTQVAHTEGLDVSEWLRDLILNELRRREALPSISADLRGETLNE